MLAGLTVIAVMLSAVPAHAKTSVLECEADNDNFPQFLQVTLEDDLIVGFSYSGMTPASDPPHKYSCSLEAARGNGSSDWAVEEGRIQVKLKDSAVPEDTVWITQQKDKISFDFSEVSVSNCGHSSTIASAISLVKGRKECVGIEMKG